MSKKQAKKTSQERSKQSILDELRKASLAMRTLLVIVPLTAMFLGYYVVWEYSAPDGPITRGQALQQAREFTTDNCGPSLAVETSAVHTETGAQYTFSSSCLPSGWSRDL